MVIGLKLCERMRQEAMAELVDVGNARLFMATASNELGNSLGEIERLAALAAHWESIALDYWSRIERAQIALHDQFQKESPLDVDGFPEAGTTGAYASAATCRHGVHPFKCIDGCDPRKS